MQHSTHLFPTPEGVTLAGTVIARRNPDGTFAVKGREQEIHTLLSAAYGKAIPPQAVNYIRRGSEFLARVSDEELANAAYPYFPNPYARASNDIPAVVKGLTLLALAGLGDIDDLGEGKARLAKVQASSDPDALLKSYGLPTWQELTKEDSEDSENDDEEEDSGEDGNGHYNPDEPRVPKGNPDGGEWTTGGDDSASLDSNITGVLTTTPATQTTVLTVDNNPDNGFMDAQVFRQEFLDAYYTQLPAPMRSISPDGVAFIAQHEAFVPETYDDIAGNPTIGYGHKLTDGESYPHGITNEEALTLLHQDLSHAESAVQNNVEAHITQPQYDALVSFAYNIGNSAFADSTLVSHLNDNKIEAAADQFLNWNKITNQEGEKVSEVGLTNRRTSERDLFLNGNYGTR